MQRILVPLDGSEFAEHAIETARAVAHRTGAALHFVTVHVPAVPPARMGGAPGHDQRLDDVVRRGLKEYVERLTRAARTRDTFAVEGSFREGEVAEEIVAQAGDASADLIVMTTHGRSGVGRMWLGSVADRVIRSAHIPVLLVKFGEGSGQSLPLRRVVICAAGSDDDDRVIETAVAVAGTGGVEYTLVHVLVAPPTVGAIDPSVGPPPDELAGLSARVEPYRDEAAERYLEWLAGPLRKAGATVRTWVGRAGSVPRAILDVAGQESADLIVVGTAARDPVARFFLGSTADKVLRAATCSVLVSPPPQSEVQEVRF